MVKIGLRNELISLSVCVLTGFVFGFLYACISGNYQSWPNEQMQSRGTVVGLADGAFIAAVSGIGVALSVMGDYASTIIGVAISASLLPPAVNAGMLSSFSLYVHLFREQYNKHHSHQELLAMAGWSLLLTLENILIIFVVALCMFKVKEVVKVKDQNAPLWMSVARFTKKKKNFHYGAPRISESGKRAAGVFAKLRSEWRNGGSASL